MFNSNNFVSKLFGGASKKPKWILVLTILLILIAIIIDITTHAKFNSTNQKAMVGVWSSLLGLYFLFAIVTLVFKESSKILNILLMILTLLQLIFGAVLVGISDNELSGREQAILYGRLTTLYLALFVFHLGRYFQNASQGVSVNYSSIMHEDDEE